MAEWTEKHRPDSLDKVVGQEKIVSLLKKYAKHPIEDLPNFLFYGPQGTGKTSTARAFCEEGNYYPRELNSAQYNGKDDIEKLEREFYNASHIEDFEVWEDNEGFVKPGTRGIIFIFDKAEKLTKAAQDVLEKYLEDGSGMAKAIFICNDISTFSEPLKSRFNQYEFKPIHENEMRKLILQIAEKENLNVPNDLAEQIIEESGGIPRNATRKLQDYAIGYEDK